MYLTFLLLISSVLFSMEFQSHWLFSEPSLRPSRRFSLVWPLLFSTFDQFSPSFARFSPRVSLSGRCYPCGIPRFDFSIDLFRAGSTWYPRDTLLCVFFALFFHSGLPAEFTDLRSLPFVNFDSFSLFVSNSEIHNISNAGYSRPFFYPFFHVFCIFLSPDGLKWFRYGDGSGYDTIQFIGSCRRYCTYTSFLVFIFIITLVSQCGISNIDYPNIMKVRIGGWLSSPTSEGWSSPSCFFL